MYDEDIQVVDNGAGVGATDTDQTQQETEEQRLAREKKEELEESRRKTQKYKERDAELALKNQEKLERARRSGVVVQTRNRTPTHIGNKKYDPFVRLAMGRTGYEKVRRDTFGNGFNSAAAKALNAGIFGKDNFTTNVSNANSSRMQNDGQSTIGDFKGFKGFVSIMHFGGLPHRDASFWMRVYIYGQYLNPFNYVLYLSLLIDEVIKDIVTTGLKDGETAGPCRFSVTVLFTLISALQRFMVTSACKPLVYLMRNPKIFTAVFVAAAAALNSVVYATQYNDDPDADHNSTYDFYKRIAEHILHSIIIPMINTEISKEDKDDIIQGLTAFLVNYSAVIIASMASQMGRKSEAVGNSARLVGEKTGLTVVLESCGQCFKDGLTYAWKAATTCGRTQATLTEAEVLRQINAVMPGSTSTVDEISMVELGQGGGSINNFPGNGGQQGQAVTPKSKGCCALM